MIEQLTNASAMRVLTVAAVVALVSWLGDKASGQHVPESTYFYLAALVFGYALIDHLHGIRGYLASLSKRDGAV
jgi:hypothetical protein